MKPILSLLFLFVMAAFCIGCASAQSAASPAPEAAATAAPQDSGTESEEDETMRMKIGETEVEVSWEDNEAVKALKELARDGLTIEMSMYGGFEQVGPIGRSLPRNDSQTTTQAGDIVLYSGNQLVVFYGSNSWAYTRLGRITDVSAEELTNLLANGDVVITLSWE